MKVKCKKCGYAWESKTKMMIVSCPCCGSKVKIEKKVPKEAQQKTSKGGDNHVSNSEKNL